MGGIAGGLLGVLVPICAQAVDVVPPFKAGQDSGQATGFLPLLDRRVFSFRQPARTVLFPRKKGKHPRLPARDASYWATKREDLPPLLARPPALLSE
jgi:hypothetical protein